jgi:glycosyltransferase involved in cell wall biosynthesis
MMNRIPFVTDRHAGISEILGVNSELYEITSANNQDLPRLILNHLAYDKNRIQDLINVAYQQWLTFCNPRKIVQWYEERVGNGGQNQPNATLKPLARVTVIIPTKNASKYLQTALQSLTTQTYKIARIIIKDSSTELEEILKTRHLAKRHGAWMIHRRDTGLANAMNQSLRYVDTKYLMQFDSDNIAMPHMIETFVRAIECRTDVVSLSSYHAQFYDEDEPRLLASLSKDRGATFVPRSYYRPVGPCLPNLYLKNVQGDATSIYLTKALKEIGGWPNDNRGHPDWLLWLRLVETGHQIDTIPEVLYYYRIRPDSLARFNRRILKADQAQISIIQGIIMNRTEVFSKSYPSIHRLLRRIVSLERERESDEMRLRERERELDEIRHSLGYRFMRFYASRIDHLLPNETRRGQFRKMMTAHLRSRT